MIVGVRASIVGIAALCAVASVAQALDCTKASSAVERTLCATPALLEQDAALAKAYGDRLAQNTAGGPALRTEQRAWLAERERLCGAKDLAPPRVVACLTGLYRARLKALAAGAAPPAQAGALPAQALPAAAVLSAPPPPTLPDLPTHGADPAASLSATTVPAAGRADVMLEVKEPGRFSIEAKSKTGVALQLVDMITGPGDQVGDPGAKDGRTDVLLDRGTYKLRTVGAPGASGDAQLTVQPFRDAAGTANTIVFGGEARTTLSDLGQRSYWIAVDRPGHVVLEAVGRSVDDLRLWRNGTDLAALTPAIDRIAPKVKHPMTRARIEGDVEPGLYRATIYGGPKLVWADGDPTEPLFMRAGDPEPMPAGWIEGVIGPFGSARFAAPDHASSFRLDLPEPAAATLSVRHGTDAPTVAVIAKNNREPSARVESAAAAGRVVEVAGQEGQPFRLRGLDPSASRSIAGSGPTWVGVDVAGEGGDELPATVVLAQFRADHGGKVIASNAPQIGPGKAWRQSFNLRGKSTLLFEVTATVQAGATVTGVKVTPTIAPLLGNAPPRADGQQPRWTLEPGWYVLTLDPPADAAGIVDVTLGPPGLPGVAQPQRQRPAISLGIQTLERGGNYQVLSNESPTLVVAPFARALPVDLETGPFALSQEPGQALDVPVRAPANGYLAATAVNGVPVAVQKSRESSTKTGQTLTLHIPAPERTRGLVLSWSNPVPGPTVPIRVAEPADLDTVVAGKPRFFDLGRDETRSFALDVPTGGLYRVETLGRLHTSVAVATPFLPKLDEATANGAGENALAQSYLRGGRYTVSVKASDSDGRVGLVARPAALPEGEGLVPDGTARASLADGRGVVFPLTIVEAGRYRLDLYALGTPLRARLEDQDGWPLTVPGPTAVIERRFDPGRYRLVVLPEPIDVRAVARLMSLRPQAEVVGHGPHPLPFDKPTAFQWREPASTGEERRPDRWEFALAGPATVTLDLSAGMAGTLLRVGDDHPLGRIVAKAGFAGRLEAGRYALEAQSLGRNDRLAYTITLRSDEIQPGAARSITLPATIPFAIAEDRVVSLTSLGRIDLRGVLKDADGHVVERVDDRTDDWNIALSRRLPAGAYRLELSAADPRPAKTDDADASSDADATDADQADKPADQDGDKTAADEPPDDPDQPPMAGAKADDEGTDDKTASDAPDDADQPAAADKVTAANDGASPAASDTEAADKSAKDEDKAETEVTDTTIAITLALPDTTDHPALALEGAAAAEGAAVHRFALPAVPAGQLMMVSARSSQDLVLSLERADAQGHWTVAGFERGRTPVVATPSDGDATRPWRVSAWAIDGGPAQMSVAARAVVRQPVAAGAVALEPVPFGGEVMDIRAALLAAPAAGLLALQDRPEGLWEGSVPGRMLQPLTDRTLVPQAESTWIVARSPAPDTLAVGALATPAGGLSLTVPAGGRASFPPSAAAGGSVRLWRAASTFGQPGLSAGRGFGVAPGSAVALAGDGPVQAWNAGGEEALPLLIAMTDLSLRPSAQAGTELAVTVPAGMAQPVVLPAGRKRLTLDLAAGTAAILGSAEQAATTVWAGGAAQSRTIEGEWTSLLAANLSDRPAPVRVMASPLAEAPAALAAGRVVKRFYGAAGAVSMRVDGQGGDRIVVAGARATFVADDGHVDRGTTLAIAGSGELTLDHAPGLVAVWVERPGHSPWPDAKAQAVALPAVVPLQGGAMALTINAPGALLLHVRTSAPVILSLTQGGQGGEPAVFPAGAEFHRLMAAGESTLRLDSPHDGPLAGSLELTASPVTPIGEGVGEATALAPGTSALFAFDVRTRSPIGVGVRADPDLITARLLDATGHSLGSGVAQLQTLDPGRYLLEASVPVDGRTTIVRPAVVGLVPPPSGPPPNVVRDYMQLVGLAPTAPTR